MIVGPISHGKFPQPGTYLRGRDKARLIALNEFYIWLSEDLSISQQPVYNRRYFIQDLYDGDMYLQIIGLG